MSIYKITHIWAYNTFWLYGNGRFWEYTDHGYYNDDDIAIADHPEIINAFMDMYGIHFDYRWGPDVAGIYNETLGQWTGMVGMVS